MTEPIKTHEPDNRPLAYWEKFGDNDTLIVRASAVGGCLWELIACAQGLTPGPYPPAILRAFEEGRAAEPIVLQMLVDDGWSLDAAQREGHLRVAPNCLIRYHPDSIGVSPYGVKYVVEVKALNHDSWSRARRHGVGSLFNEYEWQLSVMMLGENLPGMWVALDKSTGELLFQEVVAVPIPRHAIITKINSLVEALDDDLMDRPCDDPRQFPCRFLALRPEPAETADVLNVENINADLTNEFNQLAKEYVYTKGQIDELTERRERAKARLLEIAGQFKRVESGHWTLKVRNGANVHANREAIKRDGKEREYLERTEFKWLDVKGKE